MAGRMTSGVRLALIGGVFLACFVVIRASSFHHVDRLIGIDFEGVRMNAILELGSILCIAAAALIELRGLSNSQG